MDVKIILAGGISSDEFAKMHLVKNYLGGVA